MQRENIAHLFDVDEANHVLELRHGIRQEEFNGRIVFDLMKLPYIVQGAHQLLDLATRKRAVPVVQRLNHALESHKPGFKPLIPLYLVAHTLATVSFTAKTTCVETDCAVVRAS